MTKNEFILIIASFWIISPTASLPSDVSASKCDQNENVCNTKACEETANLFLKNMDPGVDPCNDFYQYACGNFIRNTEIPEGMGSIDNYYNVKYEIEKKLSQRLGSIINENDYKALKLAKKFYQSCMNTEQIERLGLSEIKKKIESLGGWPVVDGDVWDETNFNWLDVVRQLYQSGFQSSFLYQINVGMMPGQEILIMSAPSFFINSVYLEDNLNHTMEPAYITFITEIAKAFGANQDSNTIRNQMLEVWQFMKDLKNLPISDYSMGSISQLEKEYPSIPWRQYINAQTPENVTIPNNKMLNFNLGFILSLKSLLRRTPKRIIANYAMTEVVLPMVNFLNEELRAHLLHYSSAQSGITKFLDRWEKCVRHAQAKLSLAMNTVYVREYFSRESQPTNDVRDMIRHMKEALGEMIEKSNWMDYKSKVYALAKVRNIGNIIGYPEVLDDEPREYNEKLERSVESFVKKVDEHYKELEFPEGSFVDIVLRVEKFIRHKSHTDGLRDLRWKNFVQYTQSIKAVYDFFHNEIIIPAGIMHGMFYNKSQPKYMNYGTLGYILGQQMSQGFGPNGIRADRNGMPAPLMTDESQKIYDNRTKCIEDQYSDYLMKDVGMKINGVVTSNENFADTVGIVVAHSAYKKWVKEYGKEKKLPGLNRSPEEMFWLSYAVSECQKQRPLNLMTELVTRLPKSPSEARVINSLKNNPQFAKDFNCKRGSSNMNPVKKCTVF